MKKNAHRHNHRPHPERARSPQVRTKRALLLLLVAPALFIIGLLFVPSRMTPSSVTTMQANSPEAFTPARSMTTRPSKILTAQEAALHFREALAYATNMYPPAEKYEQLMRKAGILSEVRADGAIISLQEFFLTREPFYYTFIDASHPRYRTLPFPVTFDAPDKLLWIRNNAISMAMLSALAVHELSHVDDRLSGREPPRGDHAAFLEGELRAYQFELLLLDAITKGELARLAREIYPRARAGVYLEPYENDNLIMNELFVKECDDQEAAFRRAVFLLSVNFAAMEDRFPEPAELKRHQIALIEILMKESGL